MTARLTNDAYLLAGTNYGKKLKDGWIKFKWKDSKIKEQKIRLILSYFHNGKGCRIYTRCQWMKMLKNFPRKKIKFPGYPRIWKDNNRDYGLKCLKTILQWLWARTNLHHLFVRQLPVASEYVGGDFPLFLAILLSSFELNFLWYFLYFTELLVVKLKIQLIIYLTATRAV